MWDDTKLNLNTLFPDLCLSSSSSQPLSPAMYFTVSDFHKSISLLSLSQLKDFCGRTQIIFFPIQKKGFS